MNQHVLEWTNTYWNEPTRTGMNQHVLEWTNTCWNEPIRAVRSCLLCDTRWFPLFLLAKQGWTWAWYYSNQKTEAKFVFSMNENLSESIFMRFVRCRNFHGIYKGVCILTRTLVTTCLKKKNRITGTPISNQTPLMQFHSVPAVNYLSGVVRMSLFGRKMSLLFILKRLLFLAAFCLRNYKT